jgi:hypothetical protein
VVKEEREMMQEGRNAVTEGKKEGNGKERKEGG